jgi:hypothetical protein
MVLAVPKKLQNSGVLTPEAKGLNGRDIHERELWQDSQRTPGASNPAARFTTRLNFRR